MLWAIRVGVAASTPDTISRFPSHQFWVYSECMLKTYNKYRKTAISYFSKHVEFNAAVHAVGGIGVGILIAGPMANPHPVRWAAVFLIISLVGHLYALNGHGKK